MSDASLATVDRLAFGVIAGLVLFSSPWLGSADPMLLLALAAGAIAVIGLPHGAADAWLAAREGLVTSGRSLAAFLLGYTALASAVVLAWIAAPVVSLAAFLGLSAWHFGGDWKASFDGAERLAAGAVLLGAPAIFFPAEVATIFTALSGDRAAALVSPQVFAFAIGSLVLIAASIRLGLAKARSAAFVELGVLVGLAAVLPPILWFAVYFCGLHAPRHIRGLWAGAKAEARGALIWSGVVVTVATLALAGFALGVLSARDISIDVAGYQIVFIGLAALTVPHMLLVDRPQAFRVRKVEPES